ncbi:MAG: 50S ribosomal protein L25 [Candidatus Eremiobacteraeota bacterium]|nr:50S ribosomal protein L25 [Candidatus Eremiobacteraeota bacterium]MBV8366488.1 50S ribosomal protein L25 [Candidatus Eremiobacteraeota bacterium]
MDSITITAKPRSETGRHAVNKLRHEGKVPGVVYGHQFNEPLPIVFEAKDLRHVLTGHNINSVFTLEVEGRRPTPVMVHERQHDVLDHRLIHIDLYAVDMAEAVEANVSVQTVGNAPGVKEGGVLDIVLREIAVEALPGSIPDRIEIDISALGIGDNVHVRDLRVADGVKIIEDPDEIVLSVLAPQKAEEEVPAVVGAEIAQPELIGEKKPAEEETPEA